MRRLMQQYLLLGMHRLSMCLAKFGKQSNWALWSLIMPLWRFNYCYSVWECVRSSLSLYFMRIYFIRVDSWKKRLRGKAAPEKRRNISVSRATDYWIAPPKINPKGLGTTFCFFGGARTSPTSRRSAGSSFWSSTSQLIFNISLKNVSRGLEKIFQIILKFNKCFSFPMRFPIGLNCGFIWRLAQMMLVIHIRGKSPHSGTRR